MNKIISKIISLGVVIALLFNFYSFEVSAAVFAGGNGTENNPYKVSTPEQLDAVRAFLGAYFIQVNDIDMSIATGNSGSMYDNGLGWAPIGTDGSVDYFYGVYDGAGYSIKGLRSAGRASMGLFGYNKGTIKNLYVESCNMGTVQGMNTQYAGSIVGYNDGGTISNCFSSGDISTITDGSKFLHVSDKNPSVGGIIGYNSNNGKIISCGNECNLTVSGLKVYSVSGGGIVGSVSSGSIENCYSVGNVSAGTVTGESPTNASQYIGGLVGHLYAGEYYRCTVKNCYSTGNVSVSKKTDYEYVGGVAGYCGNNTSMQYCYWLITAVHTMGSTALSIEDKRGSGYGLKTDFISKTTAEIQTMATLLNANRGTNTEWTTVWGVNNRYPIFSYQFAKVVEIDPSVAPGKYDYPISLDFSSMALYSEMYYSIDDSDPRANGTIYKDSIILYGDAIIKVVVKSGNSYSNVFAFVYGDQPANTNKVIRTVTADIVTDTPLPADASILIVTYYEDGKLKNVVYDNLTSSAKTMKIMLWNNLQSISPLIDTVEVSRNIK